MHSNLFKIKPALFYLFIFGLLLSNCTEEESDSELQQNFIKMFGNAKTTEGIQILQLEDGTYIMLGTGSSDDNTNTNIVLSKTDGYGNELWYKEIGDLTDDKASDLKIMPDGGFILLGTSTVSIDGNNISHAYLIRTDKNGNLIWQKKIGENLNITTSCIDILENAFIIGGAIFTSLNNSEALIIRTDTLGENARLSYSVAEGNQTIQSTTSYSDGWLLTGLISGNADVQGSSDIFIATYNGQKIIAPFNLGGNGADKGNVIKKLNDGSFICLSTYSTDTAGSELCLINFEIKNQSPIVKWTKFYGTPNNDEASNLTLTNSGFAVCGSTTNTDGSIDILMILADSTGKEIRKKTIGGQGNQKANSIIQTSDGGFALLGMNENSGSSVMLLIKVQ